MVRIVPVALQDNPRSLWFDPGALDIREGDTVIVRTEKGLDFGRSKAIVEVAESELAKLKSPLKPVLRIATDEDEARIEDLRTKGREALPIFKKLAAEMNEDMRPVMVEYLFEGDRAIFYFEAEDRVDFRELVRRLASEFHVRVDMRQVGVRDEARLVGGLGHCGQELCCRRLGGDFNPVSIRMAKEQDLSLNPQKISGVCGRLMCCLRYEYDAYKDFKCRAPKQNAKIETPHGVAKVVSLDVPREQVTVRVEGEDKNVTFPLSAMDPVSEGAESKRPTSIGDVFEEYANPDPFAGMATLTTYDTAGFTHESKLGTAQAHHNPQTDRTGAAAAEEEGTEHRKPRRRRGRGKSAAAAQGEAQNQRSAGAEKNAADKAASKPAAKQGKPSASEADAAQPKEGQSHRRRRRRGVSRANNGAPAAQPTEQKPSQAKTDKPRPGQHSSGVTRGKTPAKTDSKQNQPDQNQPEGSTTHRRRRRSHRSTGAAPAEGGTHAE